MKSMINSSLSFRAVVLGATVFLGLGSIAVAQAPKSGGPTPTGKSETPRSLVDATPTSTSASFGDWVLRCQRVADGAVRWPSRSAPRISKTR
jgi:hypothetical protein